MNNSSIEQEKQIAAEAAVALVDEGMVVGLGSGSTAAYAIAKLGDRFRNGLKVVGIPTSSASEQQARQAGIPLTTLDDHPVVDITIDGADRFDDDLNLIKGGGGALLREKIVAAASNRVVIIADSHKRVNPLGGFPVPVEVIPFGRTPVFEKLKSFGMSPELRMDKANRNSAFLTDEGNHIIDLQIDRIDSPQALMESLRLPGIVEHGLFIGLADEILMGHGNQVTQFSRRATGE